MNKKNKYIYSLEIEGMKCCMCEAHINDVIRKNFNVKKVKSSYKKKNTIIIANEELDVNMIKVVISGTGYELKNVEVNKDE